MSEYRHVERVRRIVTERGRECRTSHRRRTLRQQARRELEEEVRREAVTFARESVESGTGAREVAGWLGLAERTLRQWRQRLGSPGRDSVIYRGRPLVRSPPARRAELLRTLERYGPSIGVEPLWLMHPEMARGEIENLLGRYRVHYARTHALTVHELFWSRAGAVWAADHTEVPSPREGGHRWILSVRDLASGMQLLWRGVKDTTAETTIAAFSELFSSLGAPLALKLDNGPGFIAGETRRFFESHGVLPLYSPPYSPSYNGSCEASGGWLKRRTAHQALLSGRPHRWRSADLETARQLTNDLPRGAGASRTRREEFEERIPMGAEERAEFLSLVEVKRLEAREEKGYPRGGELSRVQSAAVDRVAVRRTLEACGILEYRRRRIPLPIRSLMAAKIT